MFRHGVAFDEHPVVPISTEHDGLTQITRIQYAVEENGCRKLCANGIVRTMRLCLPLIFTPEVWVRHEYSLEDVVDTLNFFQSNQLWQLAVLLGIPLSNSCVKPTFSRPTAMVFSSKAIVMVKIVAFLRKHYEFSNASVLDKTHDDHVPPLPVHYIPSDLYQHWKEKALAQKDAVSMLRKNRVDELFVWKDITMALMGIEGDHLYMIRAVSADVFLQSHRETDSYAAKPVHFVLPDKRVYYGCIDEASFFLPK